MQRRQLLLFWHPLSTLWYFAECAATSAWRGLQWSSRHPVMLWCVIPLAASYAAVKPMGKDTNLVCCEQTCHMCAVMTWMVSSLEDKADMPQSSRMRVYEAYTSAAACDVFEKHFWHLHPEH